MGEQQSKAAAAGTGRPWTDRRCLLALALFVVGLRAWQLTHTEVLARDSIGYIRIAWQLEHGELLKVLPNSTQHPLYPLTILVTSLPVRQLVHADLPRLMQLSAQIASAAASVLLVVPVFYLGRELFGRRVGLGTAFLFQCLPAVGRILGDGLSEALFLFMASSGLYFAARGLRTRSATSFALAGLFSGLAYLTRPEGLLVAGATGLVLLLSLATSGSLRTRWQFLKCGACLAAAAAVVAAPYMVAIGGFTVKRTGKIITRAEDPDPIPPGTNPDLGAAPAAPVRIGPLFAVWHIDQAPGTLPTSGWALRSLAEVLARGFFHVGWVPALIGLWYLRGRFRSAPGLWVLIVVIGVLAGVLFEVAATVGYLSDRHTVLLLLCGTYWSVAGLEILGGALATWFARRPGWEASRWARGQTCAAALVLLFSAVPLAKTLEPLHKDRAGFRAAGYWLAEHAWAGDKIDDPYAWSNYYAGHVFAEVRPEVGLPWAAGPAHQPPVRYVVQEESDNPHLHLNLSPESDLRKQGGQVEQRWAVRRGKKDACVVVWSVPIR